MKSIVANDKRVEIITEEIPELKDSYLLVKTLYSVISPGTETSMINNSEGRQINIGYSAAGVIVRCGDNTEEFKDGDIVAVYGAPYVKHSQYLLVPKTLCSLVPDNVSPKEAALAGIGAIAIHGLRIANLNFGEKIIVAGLGIIGQLITQIADASAYQVYAYDLSAQRTTLLSWNKNIKLFTDQENLEEKIISGDRYKGADAVLLCAGGKKSPLTAQSLNWIRDKGKVVIVGDIEPDFPRDKMFGKEASILISRAGGPGRYDPIFERDAIDYHYGFIRWTEGRNMAEYLRLVSENRIKVNKYLLEEVYFEDAPDAYETLQNKETSVLTKVIKW